MRQTYGIMLLTVAAILGSARADTLIMEGLEQSRATADQRPVRGSSMAAVEARWGAPATKSGPVGQPPITRWNYANFVVFFEYDHVVHAVAAR